MSSISLRSPFTWQARKPLLQDGVLFVPEYYDQHVTWGCRGWDDPTLFGNTYPVHVEYCSGNGDWVVAKALEDSEKNWVAVERRFDRVRKIWSKMRRRDLRNLLIVCGEAVTFTRWYVVDGSVAAVYVNFPDPWPKRVHGKHRLIQAPFVREISRVVSFGGVLMLVTDHAEYSGQMVKEISASHAWCSCLPPPYYVNAWAGYGSSYFSALWTEEGRALRYHQFQRNSLSCP